MFLSFTRLCKAILFRFWKRENSSSFRDSFWKSWTRSMKHFFDGENRKLIINYGARICFISASPSSPSLWIKAFRSLFLNWFFFHQLMIQCVRGISTDKQRHSIFWIPSNSRILVIFCKAFNTECITLSSSQCNFISYWLHHMNKVLPPFLIDSVDHRGIKGKVIYKTVYEFPSRSLRPSSIGVKRRPSAQCVVSRIFCSKLLFRIILSTVLH